MDWKCGSSGRTYALKAQSPVPPKKIIKRGF
jgi:hypothetical protein